jgi:hypothetical protein
MKQLEVNMKVELGGTDLLAAILSSQSAEQIVTDLLSIDEIRAAILKHRKPTVTRAVDKWMTTTHNLKMDRVIYDGNRILVDAHSGTSAIKSTPVRADKRVAEGFKKENKKIFETLREYFADERKKGVTELTFDQVYADTKFFYPKLSERHLSIYLNDKRQLKNIKCDKRNNLVYLK